jgi:hypothetical protein
MKGMICFMPINNVKAFFIQKSNLSMNFLFNDPNGLDAKLDVFIFRIVQHFENRTFQSEGNKSLNSFNKSCSKFARNKAFFHGLEIYFAKLISSLNW